MKEGTTDSNQKQSGASRGRTVPSRYTKEQIGGGEGQGGRLLMEGTLSASYGGMGRADQAAAVKVASCTLNFWRWQILRGKAAC